MLSHVADKPDIRRRTVGVRQQRKQQTRQSLLGAARRVLARRGLTGLTTREVAVEAGVAAGTFFVHFPDLNALVEALLDDHVGAALDAAMRTMPTDGDLVGDLVHVARELYASYDAEPELARQYLAASLFHENPRGPTEQRMVAFRQWVGERIVRAVDTGAIAPVDPALAFTGYFSLYFGLLVLGLRGEASRAEQLSLLEGCLRRLLRMEEPR